MSRVLAVDFGERRVGLAVSDPSATLARPLPTLLRRPGKRAPVAQIARIAAEHEVDVIVVGLPLDLSGEETPWTQTVRDFGTKLATSSGARIEYMDERLTSVMAERAVRSLGLKRSERERKDRIDAMAAVMILQAYLDRHHEG